MGKGPDNRLNLLAESGAGEKGKVRKKIPFKEECKEKEIYRSYE